MDIHCWIVENDKIIDFNFPEYEMIKCMRGLTGDNIYEPVPIEEQKKWFRLMHKKSSAFNQIDPIMYKFYKNPQYGCCFVNALAYKKNSKNKCKIVIGKMGWRKKNSNDIFWEYG